MDREISEWLLLVNFAAAWYMTGLIWFVQVVHYPLMARVGRHQFAEYEKVHTRLTTWVVGPPMLVEAGTSVALFYWQPSSFGLVWIVIATGLLFVAWLSTAVFSVPMHSRLERGFDESAHRWLVKTNWLRTGAWSLRGFIGLIVLQDLL